MRSILFIMGLVTILSTSGRLIREHEHDRGGARGYPQYNRGEYQTYPDRDWDRDHWRHY